MSLIKSHIFSYGLADEFGIGKNSIRRAMLVEHARNIARTDRDKALDFADAPTGTKFADGIVTLAGGASDEVYIHQDTHGLVPRVGDSKTGIMGFKILLNPGENATSGEEDLGAVIVGTLTGVQPDDVPVQFEVTAKEAAIVKLPELLVTTEAMKFTIKNTSGEESKIVFRAMGEVPSSQTSELGRQTLIAQGKNVGQAHAALKSYIGLQAAEAGGRALKGAADMIANPRQAGAFRDRAKDAIKAGAGALIKSTSGMLGSLSAGKKMVGVATRKG